VRRPGRRIGWLVVPAALVLAGESWEVLNWRGAELFQQRRPAEAAAALERSLALNPRQPAIAKLLGLCYQLTEDDEKAESAFRRATELAPRDAEAWFFLGRHYYKMNFFDKAAEALENARKLDARDPRIHTFRGLTFEALGRVAEAEQAYRTAVAANERLPSPSFRPHFSYGALLLKLGRLAESERHLRRAVELEPSFWEPHFELAKLLYRQGRYDAARQAVESALATNTAKPEEAARLYHLLARILLDMGCAEEAAEALRKREALAP